DRRDDAGLLLREPALDGLALRRLGVIERPQFLQAGPARAGRRRRGRIARFQEAEGPAAALGIVPRLRQPAKQGQAQAKLRRGAPRGHPACTWLPLSRPFGAEHAPTHAVLTDRRRAPRRLMSKRPHGAYTLEARHRRAGRWAT